MSQRKDNKQAVDGFSGTDHKGFETHIHFLLLEHDLNFPSVGIMRKNFPIRKGKIRANEHAQRFLAAERVFGIGEQDNSLIDSVERPFIAMNPILVTAHCNKVVLAVWEHGGVILGALAVAVRVKNTVDFHSANKVMFFSSALSHRALQVYQLSIWRMMWASVSGSVSRSWTAMSILEPFSGQQRRRQ